jgi:hypothetical protein
VILSSSCLPIILVVFLFCLGKKRWSFGMVAYISDFAAHAYKRVGRGLFIEACGTCVHIILSCHVSTIENHNNSSLLFAVIAFVSAPPEYLQVGRSSIRADSGVGFCFLGPVQLRKSVCLLSLRRLFQGFWRCSWFVHIRTRSSKTVEEHTCR